MKKLEKLNKKQLKMMDIVKQEWLDRIFSCKNKTDRKQATKYINWLYKASGLKKPMIIFLSSPLGAQYGANMLKKANIGRDQVGAQVWDQVWDQVRDQVRDQVGAQVGDQVRDQVRAQVWDQVWDQVGAQVWDQVWDQVGAQVWAQVGDQVGAQVWAQVRAQVWDQVGAEKLELFSTSSYGNIWDYGWVAFYEFFQKIGIKFDRATLSKFNNFTFLLKSNIYDMIQLDGLCIVCGMPTAIHRDKENRLHNLTGPAIEWADGYKLYYSHRTRVPENVILYPEKLTNRDWMNEKNTEVRRVIQEQMGERFAKEIKGKVISRSKRGQLLEIDLKEDPDKVAHYIKVKDSSTSRVYYLRVPPTITNIDAACAWTFDLSVNDYKLEQET